MKILKLITGTLLVFALMVISFSCANQKKENGLKKVTVAHWGHSKILIYLPLYVAMDGGFFKKNGLEVNIKYSGNDDQVYATVLSGSAQFGVGDPAFTVIAGERGGKGKIIATLVGRLANWGVAKKGKFINNITNYSELTGLRISSFPFPSTTYTVLKEIIKQNNLSNVKIIEKLSFLTYEEKTAAKDRHIKNQSERASIFLAASFLTDLLRASKSFSASRRNYLKLVKEPVSHVKT